LRSHLLLIPLLIGCGAPLSAPSELELPAAHFEPPADSPRILDGVREEIEERGRAQVIVLLREGATALLQAEAQGPLGVIAAPTTGWSAARAQLFSAHRGDLTPLREYEAIPGFSAEVNAAGLAALERDARVETVELNRTAHTMDLQSDAATRAPAARTQFKVTGKGVRVAVVDTGIDANHPDFAGRIAAQRCFTNARCEPGNTSVGPNAVDRNGHGTHVSGIILGGGARAPIGIAPEAELVAVQVFDSTGGGSNDAIIAGLDWVLQNLATNRVQVLNMSLGGGLFTGTCDGANPAYAQVINRLRAAGVAVFVASGNESSITQLASPGCIAASISVGALGREARTCNGATGPVACFSNSGAGLDLLAPGNPILSSSPGNRTAELSGTSMAAPTAAGVGVLIKQQNPLIWPEDLELILERTGRTTTDARNNRVTPAVDAVAAGTEVSLTLCEGRPDGSPCNDFSLCTPTDVCTAGKCGGVQKECPLPLDPCMQTTCAPRTGVCGLAPRLEGATCEDGNRCTTGDRCTRGLCAGAAKTCPGATACAEAASCEPASGECKAAPRPEGTRCNDSNACTGSDVCRAGACVGEQPVVCSAPDACHAAGSCEPSSGLCSAAPAVADGTACGEANVCRAGACVTPPPPPKPSNDTATEAGAVQTLAPGDLVGGCAAAPGSPWLALIAVLLLRCARKSPAVSWAFAPEISVRREQLRGARGR
jgi:hypothetical protein